MPRTWKKAPLSPYRHREAADGDVPPSPPPKNCYLSAYNFALFHAVAAAPSAPPALVDLYAKLQAEITGPLQSDDAVLALEGLADALARREPRPPVPILNA